MKRFTLFLFAFIILTSCSRKHLDEKVFRSQDITVRWYRISEITTVHDFLDIERWGWKKNIMEANTGGIFGILINKDTITIKATSDLIIYDLAARTLHCHIKLDTTTLFSQNDSKVLQ